jgi:transposase
MKPEPIPDQLWQAIEPLLPPEPPRPKGGRPRVPDRAALAGILVVLRTGIPWELLPSALGYGSGMTCWRRLREWQRDGVWPLIHRELQRHLTNVDTGSWQRRSRRTVGGASRQRRGQEQRGAA